MGQPFDEIDEEEYERRRRALIMRKRQEKIRQMKIRKLTRLVIMAVLLVTVVVAAGTGITKLGGGGDKKEPSKITQEVQADTEKGETETSAAKQPVMSSSDIESWPLIPRFSAGSRTKLANGIAMQTELFMKMAGKK